MEKKVKTHTYIVYTVDHCSVLLKLDDKYYLSCPNLKRSYVRWRRSCDVDVDVEKEEHP